MTDRTARWIEALRRTLADAASLVDRGEDAYREDAALPLAFEALCSRVGDLAKKLQAADAARFADPIWSLAARNRDFVVHHYQRIDHDLLWRTVAEEFPRLARLLDTI